MKVKIELDIDNIITDGEKPHNAIARILRDIASFSERFSLQSMNNLRDPDGNLLGTIEVKPLGRIEVVK